MVASPADSAVTTPLLLTVATAVLLLVHATFWLVAFSGSIVAVRVSVSPTVISNVRWLTVTLVTGTSSGVQAASPSKRTVPKSKNFLILLLYIN
jgi:hypothetical protein